MKIAPPDLHEWMAHLVVVTGVGEWWQSMSAQTQAWTVVVVGAAALLASGWGARVLVEDVSGLRPRVRMVEDTSRAALDTARAMWRRFDRYEARHIQPAVARIEEMEDEIERTRTRLDQIHLQTRALVPMVCRILQTMEGESSFRCDLDVLRNWSRR